MPILPKRLTQLIIVFILILTPLALWVKEVKADVSNPREYYDQESVRTKLERINSLHSVDPVDTPIDALLVTGFNVDNLALSVSRKLGCTDLALATAEGKDSVEEVFKQCQNYTATGILGNYMASIYGNPPASFAWYMQDALLNAGLIKPAYAQGIGFSGLSPLLPLWKASRNIAYTILIVVMVAIGFMIIFRMKLDPKTVISVQAALPKIIITLLLITFSYAIAGFLIDLMYVSIAVLVSILSNAVDTTALADILGWKAGLSNTVEQQQKFLTGTWWDLLWSVMNFGMFPGFLVNFFGGSWANSVGALGLTSLSAILLSSATAFIPIALPALAAVALPSAIFLLIIFLGLLFTFIRLFILLLNSYIQILIAVILGPILILQEAIPGRSAFSGWLLNLIANLSVFPATVVIIFASWIISATAMSGRLWGPPLLFGASGETGAGNPLAIIIGLGIMFLAPNLVVSVKKVFQPKPTLPISAGTMLSPLTGAATTSMGAASQFYYMQQIAHTGAFAGLIKRFRPGKAGDAS